MDTRTQSGVSEQLSVIDWAADAYMTYLASCLGQVNEINSAPVTNTRTRFMHNNRRWLPPISGQTRGDVRQQILQNILPFPEGKIDIDTLLRFKNDHGYLLTDLRNYVETRCIEIANLPPGEERKELIDRTSQYIKRESQNISETMKPFWERLIFGAIIPILGAGIAVVAENPAIGSLGCAIGGLSLITTVYQAFDGSRQHKQIVDQPFAYITCAEKELLRTA
ncbi:hypothetical protein ACFLXI_08680 [Chloroflexota bacterium]